MPVLRGTRALPWLLALAVLAAVRPAAAEPPEPPSFPRDAGRAWYWLVGPFAGFRTDRGGRLHAGAELSLMSGRLTDDGAHTTARGLLLGGLVDVGYLAGPNALRASVELQAAHCSQSCGVSLGPTLTFSDAGTRPGASLTVWYGWGVFVYARAGTDFPSARYAELGVFLKVPLNVW
jgi:hypothetical protein